MHTLAGQDPFGSYIDMDVCVHSPGWKNDCDCIREEAHHSVFLLLEHCVHLLVAV